MAKKSTKKTQVARAVPTSSFDLLNGSNNVIEQGNESMHMLRARRKLEPTNIRTLSQVKRNVIPIPHFFLQFLFGSAYIQSRSLMEVIGKEGIGKSTLMLWLMGNAASSANVPSHYQESEAKPMVEEQILRILNSDPVIARAIISRAIAYEQVFEIKQSVDLLDDWVMTMRGNTHVNKKGLLPRENPLFGGIDTWSKFMSPGQAAGYYDYGDYMKADQVKNLKSVGEGSNLEHSKLAAWWCRRLPYFLSHYNVLLMLNSHQNAKIDMSGSSSASRDPGPLWNKVKIGGYAFNQNAAYQIIMAPGGQAKQGDIVTGHMVRMRMDKNSYAPGGRQIEFELRTNYRFDTTTSKECPIRFDESMAKWMADNKYLGTKADKKLYTCDALGVAGAEAEVLSKALHANDAVRAKLAAELQISGYEDKLDLDAPVIDPVKTAEELSIPRPADPTEPAEEAPQTDE